MNFGKLAGKIVTVVFLILFIIAALVIIAPFVGWHMDSVLSGSMEPTIPVGSMVISGPVSASDIHVDDIIVYREDNTEVCHRVIAVEEGTSLRFTTKGDANRAPDSKPVTPEQVTGRHVATIPLAGYLVHFIKTPIGLFLAILLPLLVLIGSELKSLFYDKKDDDNKESE